MESPGSSREEAGGSERAEGATAPALEEEGLQGQETGSPRSLPKEPALPVPGF